MSAAPTWLLSTDNRQWSCVSAVRPHSSIPSRVSVTVNLHPDGVWRVGCALWTTGRGAAGRGVEIDIARPPGPTWRRSVGGAEEGKRLGDKLIATFEREGWIACKREMGAP